MSNKYSGSITFIYTALLCEAKPFISRFKLKKDLSIQAFEIYRNADFVLTVTGIGKNAMAAGVAFTQALFPSDSPSVMLNLGIAGHRHFPVGRLVLADKVMDAETARRFYPPIVFTSPCVTHGLMTVAKPQPDYVDDVLYDMEASAFYEIASRFSTGELVHCLKIVSDNESSGIGKISPQFVTDWVSGQLDTVEQIIGVLAECAALIAHDPCPEFDDLSSRFHFSASERLQLKKLLSRRHVLGDASPLDFSASSAVELLSKLKDKIEQMPFHL